MTTLPQAPTPAAVEALPAYYDELCRAAAAVAGERQAAATGFCPSFELPPLTPALERYLSAAELRAAEIGTYRDTRLALLDLMGNPRTRTTKTLASLLMVARAVHHIRRTGEQIMILTPSSANKATALRDAVLRAIECGLVTRDELRIAVIVPEASRDKLWSSPLSTDPELAERNPVLVFPGADRSAVKSLARAVFDEHAPALHSLTGRRLWYTLDIDNYRMADAVRAFFERDHLPAPDGWRRVHAHAVSSAYGLLGHHLGHSLSGGWATDPAYFLVQHLDTPDMVLSLYFGSADRENLPRYRHDEDSGLYTQSSDPRFPATTYDPNEVLEPTFYTRQPPTSSRMNELIAAGGGGGVVVSLHECVQRYPVVRGLLEHAGVLLPTDHRQLREWSLVMAVTGVLNALDRGLIAADEVVLHGSGSYSVDDYQPLPAGALQVVDQPCQVHKAVFYAAVQGCQ